MAWGWPRPVGAAAAFVITLAVLVGVASAVTIRPGSPPATTVPRAAAPTPEPASPSPVAWPWDAPPLTGSGAAPDSNSPGFFTAVSGDGCEPTDTADAAAGYPAGSPVPSLDGGWTGRSCAGGTFWSLPMSGSSRDDRRFYALWWFVTGAVARGNCEIWVFVPKGERESDVAGNPTHYQVTRGKGDATVIGEFAIDQTSHRGSWVRGGVFRYDTGQIAVRMGNRGVSAQGGRHAAAQVAVVCTPR